MNKQNHSKKINPSEQTICMDDSTCDPKQCPHHMKHVFKTDFEVLLQDDDAHFLSGNCYAVNARCCKYNRVILTTKEHEGNKVQRII